MVRSAKIAKFASLGIASYVLGYAGCLFFTTSQAERADLGRGFAKHVEVAFTKTASVMPKRIGFFSTANAGTIRADMPLKQSAEPVASNRDVN